MKRRITGFILTFALLIAIMPTMLVQASANIDVGDYVQVGTYYGAPILWRCVDTDENGSLMLSDKIICLKPFDAQGEADTDASSHGRSDGRSSYGSNYWADSNIRSWLNSDAAAGNVTWLCGNPPDKDHVWGSEYDQEAGFLTNFSQTELNAVKEVTQKSLLSQYDSALDTTGADGQHSASADYITEMLKNYDSCYAENVKDKMFLLDVKQVNEVYNNSDILGDNYYIGELTEKVCSENSIEYWDGKTWGYWLRSPYAFDDRLMFFVGTESYVNPEWACSNYGVRPAFYLNTESVDFTSGSGTESSPYIVDENNNLITSDWAKSEIEKAEEYDLIPDVLVGEDLTQTINRAEFAAVSVKTYEALSNTELLPAVSNPFSDTADLDVLKAYNAGIAIGVSETEFEPNAQLNREQAATMLTRVFKRATIPSWTISTDSEFTLDYTKPEAFSDDKNISDWAKDSVYFMSANGIISGMGDNIFAPKNVTSEEEAVGYANATREQALAIAVRMVENFK